MSFVQQIDIGLQYQGMEEQEILERITVRKEVLADSLLILGHHYQQDAVCRFADLSGDSLKLSRNAIKPVNLLWVLAPLAEDKIVNRVQVPPSIAEQAGKSLDRMLSI